MNKITWQMVVAAAAESIGASKAEILAAIKQPPHPAELRDEFAKAAITGTLPGAAVGDERIKEYAEWAYKMADAMLEVRNANR